VLGQALTFSGQPTEGIASLETSVRLDPRDPMIIAQLNHLTIGLYFSHKYESSIAMARRTIRSYPEFPHSYRWLAAALGQLGRIEEAKEALAKAITVVPGAFDMHVRDRLPWFRPEDHAHMVEGL